MAARCPQVAEPVDTSQVVAAGSTIVGNLCWRVPAEDAGSLLLFVRDLGPDPATRWLALDSTESDAATPSASASTSAVALSTQPPERSVVDPATLARAEYLDPRWLRMGANPLAGRHIVLGGRAETVIQQATSTSLQLQAVIPERSITELVAVTLSPRVETVEPGGCYRVHGVVATTDLLPPPETEGAARVPVVLGYAIEQGPTSRPGGACLLLRDPISEPEPARQ
jgi:hypothetical protein